jgi:pimeloyl-ACP methyl ester carboxylesterase
VEVPAGHVVPAIRPHALERSVEAIFTFRPFEALAALDVPVVALVAVDDEDRAKEAALAELGAARRAAGLPAPEVAWFPADGHNLPRYRPAELAGAILRLAAR